jgi:hypothetical protein
MKTIRRLYFYAVAIISIEVVTWGVINLLRSIFSADKISNGASTLAGALSLIFVGVPIFLIHWLWAQRTSAKDDEEKTASVRAIFFYGILLGTLIPAVQNLLALIDRAFLSATSIYVTRAIVGGTQTWVDNLIAILVNLLIAAYFVRTLRNEWSALPETFTDIRRLYRFIWMLYGLAMVIYGTQQALDYVFTLSAGNVLGVLGRETAVNAIALLVIGAPIWLYAWKILQDGLADAKRAERESYLRLGILYLLSLGGVIVVLTSGGNLIYRLLMQVLGEGQKISEFVQDIGGPISIGVPFAVVWAYYGKWLDRQFSFDEDSPRRAGKRRLYFYILSLLGLGATLFAVISLLSVVIDLIFTQSYLSSSGFVSTLSTALGALAAGLPLWLSTWRPVQADALAQGFVGDHARRSVIRKTYLYLVLFASVIGGMISGGTMIFTLINAALSGDMANVAKSALNSLQALVWFVVVLLYHLSALRLDGAATADTLEEKQKEFKLVVLDDGSGFADSVKAAFAKRAPKLPLTAVNVNDGIPADLQADALVMSGTLALNPPEKAAAWIRSFGGTRLIVEDELAGVAWMNDFGQAADSAKAMAEGGTSFGIRPHASHAKGVPAWIYIAYVFAALFALQLLFMLTMFGVSLVTGF